ncbi:23S rRNA pseudouridine(2605) synthase RluB [Litoribrevibacter euphylliae]|uniref:Pseudouridine synthase n=1 Tax=Litoribrevibacter euphylliae TaxID=1834034 RepID=A0ABV7HQ26_9GAMM
MKERIQKVLSQIGVGSRREIERWITEGRIKVGDQVAQLGDRIDSRDQVFVDDRRVDLKALEEGQCRVLIYNKPEGEVCTRDDPEGRPTVFQRLPKIKGQRWISVGRLDVNTTGLLLFTTDGELANKLMHPSTGIDREYLCRIHGEVDEPMVKRLLEGVLLDDGKAQFTDVVHGGGEGRNQWFYVCLMEGRNREVRRLWESQGVEVNRLKRVRYGSVFMPSECKVGTWVEMPNKEVNELRARLGMSKIAFTRRTQQEKLEMGRRKRQQKQAQRRTPKRKRF